MVFFVGGKPQHLGIRRPIIAFIDGKRGTYPSPPPTPESPARSSQPRILRAVCVLRQSISPHVTTPLSQDPSLGGPKGGGAVQNIFFSLHPPSPLPHRSPKRNGGGGGGGLKADSIWNLVWGKKQVLDQHQEASSQLFHMRRYNGSSFFLQHGYLTLVSSPPHPQQP